MENQLISVIVPIYNVEQYIHTCLDSIINQTYKKLEIILIDDGSTDNCPGICDEYAKKDKRIKVIHKKNGGLSDARNSGLKIAGGSIISFIDSDDYIALNMFEEMYNIMISEYSDIVSCGVKIAYDQQYANKANPETGNVETMDTSSAMKELLVDGKLKQHVWNKLYKKDLIKDILFEKGKYHEDVFWSYQAIARAKKVTVTSNQYYYYIQRSNSIMGEDYSEKRLDALDAMKQRCDFIKTNFPNLYDISLAIYIGACMYHYQCAIRCNATKKNKNMKKNILSRIQYRKTGNVFNAMHDKKQKLWLHLFLAFPRFTCKVRNILKIGL